MEKRDWNVLSGHISVAVHGPQSLEAVWWRGLLEGATIFFCSSCFLRQEISTHFLGGKGWEEYPCFSLPPSLIFSLEEEEQTLWYRRGERTQCTWLHNLISPSPSLSPTHWFLTYMVNFPEQSLPWRGRPWDGPAELGTRRVRRVIVHGLKQAHLAAQVQPCFVVIFISMKTVGFISISMSLLSQFPTLNYLNSKWEC